jgi:hypothetical protein
MFNPIREIDSRWETEKRWVKDGKQHESITTANKKLTMLIAQKHSGFVRVTDPVTLPPLRTVLTFEGGPTGFESYYLHDLTLKGDGDFCICAGTANRWPACYVDIPTVRKFINEYKAAVEIS